MYLKAKQLTISNTGEDHKNHIRTVVDYQRYPEDDE
jgi:hypothetical protein